jgi:hypothetical protein
MSSRSEDLTNDLLHDLAEEQTAAPAAPPVAARSSEPARPTGEPAPSAFVETRLFLAPGTWRRPGLSRKAGSYSVSAGPLQVRFGRRSQ